MLVELLREGKIRPVVAERLALSDARRAHELLEQTASKGNRTWIKVGLNFCVPFVVSNLGLLAGKRAEAG